MVNSICPVLEASEWFCIGGRRGHSRSPDHSSGSQLGPRRARQVLQKYFLEVSCCPEEELIGNVNRNNS